MSSIRFFITWNEHRCCFAPNDSIISGYALYPSVIIVSTSKPYNHAFKNCLMYSALKYSRGIITSAIIIRNLVSIIVNRAHG